MYNFRFETLLPDYNAWDRLITHDIGILKGDKFNEYLFQQMQLLFTGRVIAFNVPSLFFMRLQFLINNIYDKYKKLDELLKKQYAITDADLFKLGDILENQASNPNTNATDPLKPLPFISDQTYTHQTGSPFDLYLRALKNMTNKLSFNMFFEKNGKYNIDSLFLSIYDDPYYMYELD